MTKDEVIAKIKAILDKDPQYRGADIKVKFSNKKRKGKK